ncbi:MAG: hypothetical protein H0X37_04025 [Herpetosiphonaceae bacterium]|nr:hypothetical protein [Herpetosiphonaceae bacterium]
MFDAAKALRLLTHVLPHVPPSLAYRFCEGAAVLAPGMPAWSAVKANMQHVRPEAGAEEVRKLARGVFVNLLKNYYDLLRAHTIHPAQLDALYQIEGLENARRALARGKGIIAVTLHSGNYSLAFEPIARALDIQLFVVVEQMTDPAVHTLLNTLRRREHVTLVPVDHSVTRRILQTLRAGGAVVLAQDRLVAAASTTIDFFDAPVDLPVGAATLALRTGASLLPVYVSRCPDNRSRVMIDPPLQPAGGPTPAAAAHATTAGVIRVLEAYIRSDPSQWLLTNAVWGIT